ncbi:MAG: AAA family ATPase [Bacteroidetes bacterium]|nr:AAA family ATPase [Bacteroidota bacterium]
MVNPQFKNDLGKNLLNMKLLILFGLPGAGKGVIAQNLKESYNFEHLSLGEYLRKEVKKKQQ